MVFILFFLFFLFSGYVYADEPIVKITDFSSNSDPEWIQLTNQTDKDIDLTGWILKDKTATNKTVIKSCVSANSSIIIVNNKTWLDNSGGDTIYLYDNKLNLIHELSYITGKNQPQPDIVNPCVIPVSTPSPTLTVTPTPPDNLVINPSSGVIINELMPNTNIEWIEIKNTNNFPVKLVNWKIKDAASNVRNIPEITINAYGFYVYDNLSRFLNDDKETINLVDNKDQVVSRAEYNNIGYVTGKSFSNVSGSWCLADETKGEENAATCYQKPTSTPKPISSTTTPTSPPTQKPEDSNLYTSSQDDNPVPINEPLTEDPYLSPPTPTSSPLPQPTGEVLGEVDVQTKRNYLPLLFIISGGGLLTSPLLINKFKKT